MSVEITIFCISLLVILVIVDIAKRIANYTVENNIEIFSFSTIFYVLIFLQLFANILLFVKALSKFSK